jgi:hypothetical protein
MILKMKQVNTYSIDSSDKIDNFLQKWNEESKFKEVDAEDEDIEEEYNEVVKQTILFDLLSSGDDNNIPEIIGIIQLDNEHKQDMPGEERIINKMNYKSWRPLYVCSINGHLSFAQLLINKGADPFLPSGVHK